MGRYDLAEQKKPVGLIISVLIILVIVALIVWLFLNDSKESEVSVAQEITLPVPEATMGTEESSPGSDAEIAPAVDNDLEPGSTEIEQPLVLPPLSESDELFRQELTGLSPNLNPLLISQQLIKKFLIIVNDFSQGQRNSKHMRFLRLKDPFVVEEDGRGMFISQRSYQRYDQLAQGFAAIDEDAAISVYQKLRPLMLQVFTGFGYPDEYQMEDIFQKAAAEIIAAPVIESRIAVVKPSVRYKFADKKLEALSPVHKQMLRMGPENTLIIQKKLRALAQRLVQIYKE